MCGTEVVWADTALLSIISSYLRHQIDICKEVTTRLVGGSWVQWLDKELSVVWHDFHAVHGMRIMGENPFVGQVPYNMYRS